jgi:hypothetical protein
MYILSGRLERRRTTLGFNQAFLRKVSSTYLKVTIGDRPMGADRVEPEGTQWVPYAILAGVLVLVIFTIYFYKHKDELMAEAFPDSVEKKKKKKIARARPNARPPSFHGNRK